MLKTRVASLTEELERKNSDLEKNLAERERMQLYLENILGNLTTGVVVLDLAGRVTLMNHAAEQMTGYVAERAREVGVASCLGIEAGLPEEYPSLMTLLGTLNDRTIRQHEGGIDRFFHLSASGQCGRNGKIVGGIVLLQDVTRIKELEQEGARKKRLASMGEMAANIAHEIRNPLGGIELFASILRKELAGDADKQGLAENVIIGVKSLNHIVSNLLYYTRPRKPVYTWFSVPEVVKESLLFAEHVLRQKGIELFVRHTGPETDIWSDGELIKQILMNLILNAVQAMPEGGALEIETFIDEKEVQCRLSDTGPGIPEEALGHIFNPFYSTREKGTGLGLGIVDHILEMLGGRIRVQSRMEEGTSFVITLPRAGTSPEERKPFGAGPSGTGTLNEQSGSQS
jgi:PAS domain S-box-containing protein